MKYIELTKCEFALVDDEDYETLSQHRWYAQSVKDGFYAARRSNGRILLLHRVLMGEPEGKVVDHINGNTLDNRKENLRVCSHSQNIMNKAKGKIKTSSQYKGVSWAPRERKWRANIMINRKAKSLGYFNTEIEAAEAYKAGAEFHFGQYAVHNRESSTV